MLHRGQRVGSRRTCCVSQSLIAGQVAPGASPKRPNRVDGLGRGHCWACGGRTGPTTLADGPPGSGRRPGRVLDGPGRRGFRARSADAAQTSDAYAGARAPACARGAPRGVRRRPLERCCFWWSCGERYRPVRGSDEGDSSAVTVRRHTRDGSTWNPLPARRGYFHLIAVATLLPSLHRQPPRCDSAVRRHVLFVLAGPRRFQIGCRLVSPPRPREAASGAVGAASVLRVAREDAAATPGRAGSALPRCARGASRCDSRSVVARTLSVDVSFNDIAGRPAAVHQAGQQRIRCAAVLDPPDLMAEGLAPRKMTVREGRTTPSRTSARGSIRSPQQVAARIWAVVERATRLDAIEVSNGACGVAAAAGGAVGTVPSGLRHPEAVIAEADRHNATACADAVPCWCLLDVAARVCPGGRRILRERGDRPTGLPFAAHLRRSPGNLSWLARVAASGPRSAIVQALAIVETVTVEPTLKAPSIADTCSYRGVRGCR